MQTSSTIITTPFTFASPLCWTFEWKLRSAVFTSSLAAFITVVKISVSGYHYYHCTSSRSSWLVLDILLNVLKDIFFQIFSSSYFSWNIFQIFSWNIFQIFQWRSSDISSKTLPRRSSRYLFQTFLHVCMIGDWYISSEHPELGIASNASRSTFVCRIINTLFK